MNTICFVHANGFPAGSYLQLFRLWSHAFEVVAPSCLGHDPAFPVRAQWREQVHELISWMSQHVREPVWGVGHSFGAVVQFMAAYERPDLFNGVIMLDPPLVNGPESLGFMVASLLGRSDQLTPAGRSRTRKRSWRDWEEVLSYFKNRPFYQQLHPDCLEDYLQSGLQQQADGHWSLVFDPDIEVEIFRQTPHQYWRYWRHLKVPGMVIRGQQSEVTTVRAARRLAHQHGLVLEELEGGHLFPLQFPHQSAQKVMDAIAVLRRITPL